MARQDEEGPDMIPVTIEHHDEEGEREIATMLPGLPAIGTHWSHEDTDRKTYFRGRVTDVHVAEIDGEIDVRVVVEEGGTI